MKVLVLQPVLHDAHYFIADAIQRSRRCAYSEGWKKPHGSVYGERLDTETARPQKELQRLHQSQLVNKWLALKRRTTSLPVVSSPSAGSGRLSSDVNGNQEVKRTRIQDHVNKTQELPIDPRIWTPYDVGTWLRHMAESHDLEVDPSFFQMNGRGLCLMPLKGFLFRVPDHGKLLYEDFRGRLRRCLLVPGQETRVEIKQEAGSESSHEAARPSEKQRKPRGATLSYKRDVVVGKSSVTDSKGQVLTYHTL